MENKFKRLIAVLLAVVITLGSAPFIQSGIYSEDEVLVASAASISLQKTKVTVTVGQTYKLKLLDTKGKAISASKIKWSTSDKKIATVSSTGEIKAIKKGNVKITAQYDKKTYTCRVSCVNPKLKFTAKTIAVGEKFTQTLTDSSGKAIANKEIKWKTSDKKKATVSDKGEVAGVKAGKVTISATYKGTEYKSTVTAVTPTLKSAAKTIAVGETFTQTLLVSSKAASGTVKWSTSDKKIATVDSKGKVTAVKAGKATITATYYGKTYKSTVTVVTPVFKEANKTLVVGETFTQSLLVNGKAVSGTVKWSTSDKSIVTVSSKGEIKGVKPGNAKIYAEYLGKKYSTTVNVCTVESVVDIYNSAVNTTKKQQKLTIKESNKINLKVENAPIGVSSIISGVLGDLSKPEDKTYVFNNGKTSDGIAVNSVIPPYDREAALLPEYVQSASIQKSGSDTTVKIVMKPEKETFDGKTYYAAKGVESVQDSMGLEELKDTVDSASVEYYGTVLTAVVNSNGLLTKLDISTPLKIEATMSKLKIGFKGTAQESWKFTY